MKTTDRCDRCGAQAYTRWERDEDMAELTFCAHCTKEQSDALRLARFVLRIDDRHLLEQTPEVVIPG